MGRSLPRLHVIADDNVLASADGEERLRQMAEACGPALAIQLRARASTARRTYDFARRIAEAAAATGASLLVSDRLDVALAVGARGVHLREDSIPAPDARTLARDFLVGRSIHSPGQAAEPWTAAADYLVFGAVWPTQSHPGRPAAGAEALQRAVERARTPVLAIGGVDPERAATAQPLGAWGVVVRSGVWSSENPARAAIRYLDAMGETQGGAKSPKRGQA